MEVRTISTFKRAIFVLFVVLVPAQCRFQNAYTWNATCDPSFLMLRFRFEKPFEGVIYAEDHKYDPACSFRAPVTSNDLEVTLKIDPSSCGISVQSTSSISSKITLNVGIQQHNILETHNDIMQPVSCSIPDVKDANKSYFSKPPKPEKCFPRILSKVEIKQGYAALGTKLALELELFNKSLLVFSVPNSGVIKDINIKNCLLHEKMILDEDSFFYPITHPSGCQNTSSDIVSAFKVVNNTETGNLVAYAQIKPLKPFLTEKSFFLSCEAQLCGCKCLRNTTRDSTAVATHIISKRSTNDISGLSTQKTSDAGRRFMKSTIKSLLRKFLQQAKARNDTNFEQQAKAKNDAKFEQQAKARNDAKFEQQAKVRRETNLQKRVLHVRPNETSTVPADMGIPAYSFKNVNEEFTDSSRDYELDTYKIIDDRRQLDEEYNEDSSSPGYTAYTTERWLDNQNESSMTIVTAEKEDIAEKRKQRELLKKERVKEYGNSKEFEESNDYNETLVTVEPTEFEITNLESFNFTTLPSNSFKETVTEIKENELTNEDFDSMNESVGNCSMNDSRVSQPIFLIVTILLGFIIFTLTLVICGMALYIKKEKKRHLIDNFLLYSFY